MKKLLLILTAVLGLTAGNSFSQTLIPCGVVSGTWTKTNSPYLIQCAIMIANSTTLTI